MARKYKPSRFLTHIENVRNEHPDWSEDQIHQESVQRRGGTKASSVASETDVSSSVSVAPAQNPSVGSLHASQQDLITQRSARSANDPNYNFDKIVSDVAALSPAEAERILTAEQSAAGTPQLPSQAEFFGSASAEAEAPPAPPAGAPMPGPPPVQSPPVQSPPVQSPPVQSPPVQPAPVQPTLPPAGAPPGGPMPGPPPVQSPPVQPAPVQPTLAPEEDSTPTPSPATPAPVPGTENAGAASAFRDLGSAVGYAFGSLGGPLGSSIGMAAGGMLGTLLGGGKLEPGQVAKTALGVAGGAIAGTAGRMVGSALGGLFGQGQEGGGGGEIEGGGGGEGGAVSVSGGGMEGEPGEMTRLLREMSMNIKALVNDGILIKGGYRRAGGSVI